MDTIIGAGALQDAGRMGAAALESEPWRAVTALTLHVDAEHAATNVAAAAFCSLLLARRTGLGVSVAVAVAAGAAGNALAYVADPSAVWVGASTAVFGLLGALCAAYRSLALCALSALLCYASHAAGVATAAHVAGWIAGVAVGFLADREHKCGPLGPLGQLVCAFGAAAVVAVCWALALSA